MGALRESRIGMLVRPGGNVDRRYVVHRREEIERMDSREVRALESVVR